MKSKPPTAFITTRKGFCYLTIRESRQNFDLMRIRKYTLDAEDKRDMRRLYPDVTFDWKKITQQLAEKREVCRSYRSRRQPGRRAQPREPFFAVYEPGTRTAYASGIDGSFALLDALLQLDPRLLEDRN